jgi:hypothetical protein
MDDSWRREGGRRESLKERKEGGREREREREREGGPEGDAAM